MIKIVNAALRNEPETPPHDKCGGPSLIETAGYVSKENQLRMIMSSGAALEDYRRKMFPAYEDPNNPDPEPVFDPTAQKGFDFFDAAEMTVVVRNNMELSIERAKRDAARLAQEAAEDSAGKEPPLEAPAAEK
ncbi:MAG: hypothetical protein FWB85_05205 [Chitinispirillia bacterium]|nr:hypothetical protein [Chitinispirillia bacterium]